ncbi:MAG: DNA repair protein RecN, partial [Mycobacteriaceae bacterium]
TTFTTGLLTLHGQNDQLRLMRSDEQRGALDRFAGVAAPLERYRKLRDEWLIARRDLVDRTNRAREMAQEADRLKFALTEIDSVDPRPGEDESLVAQIRQLSELDAVREAAADARDALSGADEQAVDSQTRSATDFLVHALTLLESSDDTTLIALGRQLTDALTVVGDVGRELGDFLAALPTDASALETKLARQGELRTLIRKYAADVDGVLSWASDSRQRLAALDVSEEALSGLARRVEELGAQVGACAVELSKKRRKAATGLAKSVTTELAGLAMADADFTVAVATMSARNDDSAPLTLPSGELAHAGADGVDAVEFGFTAHRGTQDRASVLPLNKSASGGELSRVMLALEVVLAASAEGTTMVFDEIDAGVGGRAAVQIGRRLARLARTHQVIVVTHLPQVAAYADTHLVVDTAADGVGAGASEVRRLDAEDRVAELARMLAGLGESDTGRAHARELLAAAQEERAAP